MGKKKVKTRCCDISRFKIYLMVSTTDSVGMKGLYSMKYMQHLKIESEIFGARHEQAISSAKIREKTGVAILTFFTHNNLKSTM